MVAVPEHVARRIYERLGRFMRARDILRLGVHLDLYLRQVAEE